MIYHSVLYKYSIKVLLNRFIIGDGLSFADIIVKLLMYLRLHVMIILLGTHLHISMSSNAHHVFYKCIRPKNRTGNDSETFSEIRSHVG